MVSIGIDSNQRFLRIAEKAKKKIKNSDKVHFINMMTTPQNISVMPRTDATILFSLWHHWYYSYGIEEASKMLKSVWNSTNKVLFFESGEEEVKEEFKLPFDKKASHWLADYLKTTLNVNVISELGEFEAGNYEHYQIKNHKRTVFMITKDL